MLYRAAMIGITGFWLVMMALLIRLETHPEDSDILAVPVPYVMRMMFRNGQSSLLNVREGTTDIGTLQFRPSMTGSNGRMVDFSGSLALPGQPAFSYSGEVQMDSLMRMRNFHVAAAMREPHYHLSLVGDAASDTLRYETRLGDRVTGAQTLPMEPGAVERALAQNLGLDQRLLPVNVGGVAPPVVTAREARIALRSGTLQVYQVTVAEGTAPVLDFYVTQLGQIVRANTSFGCTLDAGYYSQ